MFGASLKEVLFFTTKRNRPPTVSLKDGVMKKLRDHADA